MRLAPLARAARCNFFDVVTRLPNKGLGTRVRRKSWEDDSFWTVLRVRPTLDGRHGVAHGVLTWKGVESERPTKIRGVLKSVWKSLEAQPATPWIERRKPKLELKQPEEAASVTASE